MKRNMHYLLIAAGLFLAQISFAQVEIGAKAGVSFADVRADGINFGNNFLDPRTIAGVTAGLYSEIPMGSGFYFAPEVRYAQKGFSVRESMDLHVFGLDVPIGAEAVTRMHYIDVPLALKYRIGEGAVQGYLKAGPTLGYAVGGSVTTRINSIIDIKVAEIDIDPQGEMYNAFEVGGMVGAGLEIPTARGKFFVDASYTHGLTNIFDVPVVDLRVKNKAFGVGIGYALNF
jgi:hypothetical protein